MKKKIISYIMMILMIITLNGCAPTNNQVAYTVYPVGYILQRVAGNSIKPVSIQDDSLIQRARLKDDYKEILTNSNLYLHIGQLEPYSATHGAEINKLISSQIDLSSLNAIYTFKRYTPVLTDGDITYVEGPYYKGDEFNMIDVNAKDLNLWLDPIAMLSMSKDIRDWLIAKYPDDKSVFESNYKALETDLVRIDAAYQSLATKVASSNKEIKFVSMIASFGNWQKTYGFQVYPVILSKFGALPNDEQLDLIKTRIKNDNVKYIVYEPNMTPDMIELFNNLEEELKLTRVELSNLSSLTQSQKNDGKDYISIMYENLSVLETMAKERDVLKPIQDDIEEANPEEVVQ